MTILQSASKTVFVLMALATIAGLFLHVVDPKDFMVLSTMAFAFYFTTKGNPTESLGGK